MTKNSDIHEDNKENAFRLGKALIGRYKMRSFIVIVSFLAAGIAEAMGAASLLPLLSILNNFETVDNQLGQYIFAAFEMFNIPLRLETVMLSVLVLITLKAIFLLVAQRNVGYATANTANNLRVNMIRGLMNARWHHFQSLPSGNIANAIGTEAERASQSYQTMCKIISDSIIVLVYLLMTSLISWQLTIVACLVGAAVMAVLYRFVAMVKAGGKAQTKHMASLSSLVTDSIGAVKIIKAMGRSKYFINLLRQDSRAVRESRKKQIIGNQFLTVVREPIFVTITVLGMYLSYEYANLSMVSIITFAFMFLRISQKITGLQVTYQKQVANESAYWSIMQKVKAADDAKEVWDGTKTNLPLEIAIMFDGVSFSHVPTSEDAKTLDNVSIRLDAKKFNVVIGSSGAGKTTFIDLILGFYKPQSGKILIDETDLQDADLQDWRNSVGYVPQECPLLHDSIYHNITMGQDSFTEEMVYQALDDAGAKNFVEKLPNGVYEIVGERGQRFSGGERQRIAIARALISKPKLLLLDEATSALDKNTEKDFLEMIKALSKDITVIAITHNQTVLDYADNAFRIDKGVISEYKGS